MSKNTTTFGDTRKLIVETIIELKSGKMDVSRGLAIAANMKVLNDSIQVEINAAKLSLSATQNGKDFGEIMKLGRRPLVDGSVLLEEEGFIDD